jgi:hypothetical protein
MVTAILKVVEMTPLLNLCKNISYFELLVKQFR